jgi:flagellar basal body-associated protein FliL
MSVIDDIKAKLATATPLQKFVFYVALPVLLVFALFGKGGDIISQILEQSKRKSVDNQDKKVEAQEAVVKAQVTQAETVVTELEKEKEDAVKKAALEDPASAINNRYDPPSK